ncbi:MAG TPA: hypothetical protein DCL15_12085 [Chloroflexi bacterium]|nr:hypothetical protein [Chloroflexota bacterium]HHW87428.1 hypothetical protein [Chloroflexota bacterium]
MSTRKPTPDNILDDVLGAAEIDEAMIEIPVFQPAPPSKPKVRPARRKAQIPPADVSEAAPPVPLVVKPVEWEYREVIFRDYRGWRVRCVDGREQANWKQGPTLLAYLEQAGKEGWELVSISDRHHNQKEAYLKRAK